MLELVRRTGTEFGIAIILASHLLGEIERVCDFLVAIEAGRLLRAAPLSSFTERTGVVRVELEEDATPLADRLAAGGLELRHQGRDVFVVLADVGGYDLIRDAVADLGLGLARIEPMRRTLEDLFSDEPDEPVAAA
jgi:ABC-2 type transport system ATP-binding protein